MDPEVLPDEVWVFIMGFLDTESLVRLGCSNTHFRRLIGDAIYYKKIHIYKRVLR